MTERRTGILVAIALFRLAKAVVLLIAAAGVLHLRTWVGSLPFQHEHAFVDHAIAHLTHIPSERIRELAVGMVVYAVLFTVEGIGLLLGKTWAELLTIIATASFIPFEVFEVVRRTTFVRVTAVVLNAAIVAYLVWRRKGSSKLMWRKGERG